MLSVDTRPSTAGGDARDDDLSTPSFRQDLEKCAPHLINEFDYINRSKNGLIEDYAFRYNQVKADLIKKEATVLSDESQDRSPRFGGKTPGSASTGSSGQPDSSPLTSSNPTSPHDSYEPQPATRAKHRVALSISTKNDTHSETSSARAQKTITTNETILTIRVQIRLLPAITILKGPDGSPDARARARKLAHSALEFANANNASHPLVARCSFYIALATYDPKDNRTTQDAVTWFERATEASDGGFPEGQMAEEWLNHYQSLRLDSRPNTAGSRLSGAFNGMWNLVFKSKDNAPGSAAGSLSVAKSRPTSWWGLYNSGNDQTAKSKPAMGERIPSFSTVNTSENAMSASPSSGNSSATQDHHGLKWSHNSPWGKGEIVQGRGRFEMVRSPEPIYEHEDEEEEEEEEQYIPANVLGGLVEAGALSPAMQRSPGHQNQQQEPSKRSSICYIPPGVPVQTLRITNLTSPPESPISPGSAAASTPQKSPTSYFASKSQGHSRAQSNSLPQLSPAFPVTPHGYAQSEPAGRVSSMNKKRLSIPHLIRASGRDVARTRDEAARMEEGESPFAPRAEEEGLYRRRRSSDVVVEEV